MLAKDKYMPHAFMVRGDRLGFSNGIIFLGVASALLVLGFHGNTESLIPLYAVGVFIPFTLSQLGMMIRWLKLKPQGWVFRFVINSIGMLTTLGITLNFIITKFSHYPAHYEIHRYGGMENCRNRPYYRTDSAVYYSALVAEYFA